MNAHPAEVGKDPEGRNGARLGHGLGPGAAAPGYQAELGHVRTDAHSRQP